MELQEKISLEIQEEKVGSVMRVVIDREEPEFYGAARSLTLLSRSGSACLQFQTGEGQNI